MTALLIGKQAMNGLDELLNIRLGDKRLCASIESFIFVCTLSTIQKNRQRLSRMDLRARAHLVAFELEIEAASCETEFACGARDVAAMFAQGFGNHAALEFTERVSQRGVLAGSGSDHTERRD